MNWALFLVSFPFVWIILVQFLGVDDVKKTEIRELMARTIVIFIFSLMFSLGVALGAS